MYLQWRAKYTSLSGRDDVQIVGSWSTYRVDTHGGKNSDRACWFSPGLFTVLFLLSVFRHGGIQMERFGEMPWGLGGTGALTTCRMTAYLVLLMVVMPLLR